MNFIFPSADIAPTRDTWYTLDRFEWKIMVEVGTDSLDTHLEEVTMTLKRSKLLDGPWGPWRAVRSEIEAVVGCGCFILRIYYWCDRYASSKPRRQRLAK